MVHPYSLLAVAVAVAIVAVTWWRRVPVVMGLTLANFAVFAAQMLTGGGFATVGSPLTEDLAARVRFVTEGDVLHWYTFVTATMLHAGAGHLLGNMLIFLMLGLPFEERIGRARLLTIYVVTAVWAVLLHALWIAYTGSPRDLDIPLVGASGAVFGILGAFATMYPRDQVPMFLVFIFLQRVPVFLGAVVMMALEGLLLFGTAGSGVARAAHLGGALGGFVLGLLLRPRVPPAAARAEPRKLDYAVLERLATRPDQRNLVEKLRANEDHADTQRAWLDRLIDRLDCPQCGMPLQERRGGVLVCERGHEERYVARA